MRAHHYLPAHAVKGLRIPAGPDTRMALHSSTAALRQVLLSPGSFFADRGPGGGVGLGVVAAVAATHLLVVFGGLLLLGVQAGTLDDGTGIGEAASTVAGTAFGEGVVLSLLVFVNWLLVSVVLHVPAKVLHGDGTFGDTLFVVGWSSPVALLLPAATIAATLFAVSGAASAEAAAQQFGALRAAVDGAGALATVGVLVWQAVIWVAGLKRTHDMPGESAGIAAFVTVCLGLLVTLAA
jgi:hypothetical protein